MKLTKLKEIIRDEIKKITESLPVTAKAIKSTKRMKPPPGKKDKAAYLHHKIHSGPHITGKGAEHATYDFDDSSYDVEGGLQDREDTQDRGYEPVEKIKKQGQKKEVKEFINKFDKNNFTKLLKRELIKELSTTTVTGRGLDHGDSWPDGLFTKYGERRVMTQAGMPRGMEQLTFPASDSVYGGAGSLRETPGGDNGIFKRSEVNAKNKKIQYVIDPKELRDDTPPLAPKQRVFGRRQHPYSPDYIIPKESANFAYIAKDVLIPPQTPPEGSVSGEIPLTPEPGGVEVGGTGYRQLQKGGEGISDVDPLYILKMMGKYDPKKEKM